MLNLRAPLLALFFCCMCVLAGCRTGSGDFDIPVLLAQDYNGARRALGQPEREVPSSAGGFIRDAIWRHKDGHLMIISYSKSGKPESIVLSTADDQPSLEKEALLKLGHLAGFDQKYSLMYMEDENKEGLVESVIILPSGN
jgi:hypothetical protein